MSNGNPWFWGSKTRQQFEQELQRDAVLLQPGFGTRKPVKNKKDKYSTTKPHVVDIEAVRARKNKLIASGVLKPASDAAVARMNGQS